MSLIIKPDGTSFYRPHQSALTLRKLNKRPRAPARAKHWRPAPGTRLTEANLSLYEAELGVAAVAWDDYGLKVGRILGYDALTNTFTVTAKRPGLAYDTKIPGWRVSQAILAARIIAGVKQLKREVDL